MRIVFYTSTIPSVYDEYIMSYFKKHIGDNHEVFIVAVDTRKTGLETAISHFKSVGFKKGLIRLKDSQWLKTRRLLMEAWIRKELNVDLKWFKTELDSNTVFYPNYAVSILYAGGGVNGGIAQERIKYYNPDILIQAGAGILKPNIFNIPKLGTLNVHFGMHIRGISSPFWSMYYGIPAGVTIHYIEEGIDTGGILLQDSTPPTWGFTYQAFVREHLLLAAKLLVESVDTIKTETTWIKPMNGIYKSQFTKKEYLQLRSNCWSKVMEVMDYEV